MTPHPTGSPLLAGCPGKRVLGACIDGHTAAFHGPSSPPSTPRPSCSRSPSTISRVPVRGLRHRLPWPPGPGSVRNGAAPQSDCKARWRPQQGRAASRGLSEQGAQCAGWSWGGRSRRSGPEAGRRCPGHPGRHDVRHMVWGGTRALDTCHVTFTAVDCSCHARSSYCPGHWWLEVGGKPCVRIYRKKMAFFMCL